jgi:HSP20 family molecular chaperone IbpA
LTEEEKRVPVRVTGLREDSIPEAPTKHNMGELNHKLKDYFGRRGVASAQVTDEGFPSVQGGRVSRDPSPLYTDLFDSGSEYRVLIEVPGSRREDIDIVLNEKGVRIEIGTRLDLIEGHGGLVGRESSRLKILRSVKLPEEVMSAKAQASLNNGVLEVRIPKRTPTSVSKHRIIAR